MFDKAYPNLTLGIIAGGQLGKMLIQAASCWDIQTHVLDPSKDCPSAALCNRLTVGHYRDYDAIYAFGKQVDLLTYELEDINIEALMQLKKEGLAIYPDPSILATIQDKGLQKAFYHEHSIPSSAFTLCEGKEEVLQKIADGEVTYPFVQKARRGGYDGRGVAVITDKGNLDRLLDTPSVIEQQIAIDKELAVIVCGNGKQAFACFPSVEMKFHPVTNQVEEIICPALVDPQVEERATSLALDLARKFEIRGTLAVEMFLDHSGDIWVNEVAPRPHNSGHHTIDSSVTSQFQQHLRAIFGWPLGSTQLVRPAVMLNLLGEEGENGPAKYEGFEELLATEGANVHIYGKKETRPNRKMGHLTVVDKSQAGAIEKARQLKDKLKIKAWTSQQSVS